MYTASTALLEALRENGVNYIFANLGSDYPPILESLAEACSAGRKVPRLLTCPHEMVALSAAQGFAQVSGKAQAVFVHVDLGTQQLGGAVHNAARGRIPVLIFAGASPFTQEGELRGSRNEFIQWVQDVYDQRGIVRGYVKYNNELRTGKNIRQIVSRALQIAYSDPKGPVYLMAAREVLEEEVSPVTLDRNEWQPVMPAALPAGEASDLLTKLLVARRPLIVTTYLGRNPQAVEEMVRLCRKLSIGVLESVPTCMNFPAHDPMYQGSQWNEQQQNPILEAADFVLVLDSDVPWIPLVSHPQKNATVWHVDVDPLKEQTPLWYIPAKKVFRADAAQVLKQLNELLQQAAAQGKVDARKLEDRRTHYAKLHEARDKELEQREKPSQDAITPEFLTACIRRRMNDDTLVANEGISNYHVITDHLAVRKPGTTFTSGGASLGWSGGAALGMKLAKPAKTVFSLIGDGSYLFSVPSAVHWMARKYKTPFLQVIYNNGGWRATKFSTLALHGEGYASKTEDIGVTLDPPADYSAIASAAGGAYAEKVSRPQDLELALDRALKAVREEQRCAVLDVVLPHL